MYSAGVIIAELPTTLRLSLLFTMMFPDGEPHRIKMEMRAGNHVAGMQVEIQVVDPSQMVYLPTPPLPLRLEGGDDIKVLTAMDDGDLVEVASFSVAISQDIWTMYPIGPETPSEQSPPDADPKAS